MMENKELELVADAIAGNRYAFSQLVQINYQNVYRLCYKYCGIREDAEDITQEVFARLGSAIFKFKGDSAFKTWLYRIAMNAVTDHFRKNKRRSKNVALDESFEIASEDDAQDEVVYKKQIIKSVNSLPDKLKQAVILVYSEDMNHAEAAKILGCSEGTVSWRIYEAKKILMNIKDRIKMFFTWLF